MALLCWNDMCCPLRACCICPHHDIAHLIISECASHGYTPMVICTQEELPVAEPSTRHHPGLPPQGVPCIDVSESASVMAAALESVHKGHHADHMPARSLSRPLDRMPSCGILRMPRLMEACCPDLQPGVWRRGLHGSSLTGAESRCCMLLAHWSQGTLVSAESARVRPALRSIQLARARALWTSQQPCLLCAARCSFSSAQQGTGDSAARFQ